LRTHKEDETKPETLQKEAKKMGQFDTMVSRFDDWKDGRRIVE
jgi:hypothetical protein